MKKSLLLLSVLGLLTASRCGEMQSFELGVPFEMAPEQTFERIGGDLTVTFTGVTEDSRCPKDVTCVWEGQAISQFRLEKGKTSREIQLTAQAGQPRLAVTEALGYVFTLRAVTPYPESGKTTKDEDYRVELQVDKP